MLRDVSLKLANINYDFNKIKNTLDELFSNVINNNELLFSDMFVNKNFDLISLEKNNNRHVNLNMKSILEIENYINEMNLISKSSSNKLNLTEIINHNSSNSNNSNNNNSSNNNSNEFSDYIGKISYIIDFINKKEFDNKMINMSDLYSNKLPSNIIINQINNYSNNNNNPNITNFYSYNKVKDNITSNNLLRRKRLKINNKYSYYNNNSNVNNNNNFKPTNNNINFNNNNNINLNENYFNNEFSYIRKSLTKKPIFYLTNNPYHSINKNIEKNKENNENKEIKSNTNTNNDNKDNKDNIENSNNNSIKKFITNDNNIDTNNNNNIKTKQFIFRHDCILKRIKTKINDYILNKLNSILLKHNTNKYLFKLPKQLISCLKIELNRKLIKMKIKEIYCFNFDIKEATRTEHNIKIISEVKIPEFVNFTEKSFVDCIEEYIISPAFKSDCSKLEKLNGSEYVKVFDSYVKNYINKLLNN